MVNIVQKVTFQGKATLTTAALAFTGLEGLAHLGMTGLYVASAATAIAYIHGQKLQGVAYAVQDAMLASSSEELASSSEELAKMPTTHAMNYKRARISRDACEQDATILLGIDRKNHAVRRHLANLKSVLILGLPGQGKSTLAASLVGQVVGLGGRILLIDRHAKSDESLSHMLSPFSDAQEMSAAYDAQGMLDALCAADEILSARMQGEASSETPFLLVIDEITNLLSKKSGEYASVAQKLSEVVESICEMGRKYNCFCIAIGQLTNASRTGGTEIRELFTTRLIGGMSLSQAKIVLPKDAALLASQLQIGEWICCLEGKEEPFKITGSRLSSKQVNAIAETIQRDTPPYEEVSHTEEERYIGNLNTDVCEKVASDAQGVSELGVEIGRDNVTKAPISIDTDTFERLVQASRKQTPLSVKSLQALLGCSEQHAKNCSKLVEKAARQEL